LIVSEWARAGHVRRAHGLRGRLAVRVYLSRPPESLAPGTEILIGDAVFTVDRCRVTGPEDLLVDLEEVSDREGAEALAGRTVSLCFTDLADGAVPLPALLGMAALGVADDSRPPRVTAFHPVRGNPLVTVGEGSGAVDLPLALLAENGIDWREGTIRFVLPQGLEEALDR
jgi:ribosomal protein L35AE/L33A